MRRAYAGVGSRATPDDMLALMRHLGKELAQRGYLLRSGGAQGADQAFESGCDQAGGAKEIFLPWSGFEGRSPGSGAQLLAPDVLPDAMDIAASAHPRFRFLKRGARLLHTRNVAQVLGPRLDDPVAFVLCWTPGGAAGGGTGMAIRIAQARGIPVYDLGDDRALAAYRTNEGIEPAALILALGS